MHVLAIAMELHLPGSHSLKDKRSVVQSILAALSQRHQVAAAETDHLDLWQRVEVGVAVIAGTPGHCEAVADDVERHVWSVPDVEVLAVGRHWLEIDA